MIKYPSQDTLKKLVKYDMETGDFTHLTNSPRGAFKIGDVSNLTDIDGYKSVYIYGVGLSSHRLAFLYVIGKIPEIVDHINGIRGDNRWCNLRPANHSKNGLNAKCRSDNILGVKGVSYTPRYLKPFKAVIRPITGKRIIKRFSTIDEAAEWLTLMRPIFQGAFARDK